MIISTREGQQVREHALQFGVSQISGGSRTSVGGYNEPERPHDTEQFDVSDQRTLDEVISWLMDNNHIPILHGLLSCRAHRRQVYELLQER